jgi:U3 small nucleolar RNA-associated protein 19
LWELAAHAAHYHAPAGALAKVFAQPFTKPGYALDEFVDHSYATVRPRRAGSWVGDGGRR